MFYNSVHKRKGAFYTPFSLTIPLNVSIHLLQGTVTTFTAKTIPTWCSYISFKGTVMEQFLKLKDAMTNNLISVILLAWCIIDYFKSSHISNNQVAFVLIAVVLVIIPYSRKIKFFGIEFVRSNETKKKKVTKNDKPTNSSC